MGRQPAGEPSAMPSLRLLLTLLTVVARGRLVGGAFTCPAQDGFTCSSCFHLVNCIGGEVAMEFDCPTGQLCRGDPKFCSDLLDPVDKSCRCIDFPSYVEDFYDDQKYVLCLSETVQMPGSCPEGEVFSSADPPCVAGPPTTTQQPIQCTEFGFFPVLPGCGGYYACFTDSSGGFTASPVIDCEGDKLFNPDSQTCVDSIEPASVICPTDKVAVVDPVECNAFHLCHGGNVISGPICCPAEGQVFNSDTMICEADTGNVECPTPNPCVPDNNERFCLPSTPATSITTPIITTTIPTTITTTPTTTTTTPTTTTTTPTTTTTTPTTTTTASIPDCSTTTGARPIPGECKKYYYCFKGMLYVLTCLGDLVFNPNNNNCDLPSNYPCP